MSQALKMWIGGKWVHARSGKTRSVVNPTDQSILATVPEAGKEDVAEAVAHARAAFDDGPFSRWTGRERGTLLYKVAEAIRARAPELAEIETRNMGKPIVESEFDIADAAHCFEYYAGLAGKIEGETLSVPDNALSMVIREPVGVVGQIIPWNYPLLMAAWKLAPALAAGCTAVLKPAEQTPLSALILAQIFEALELPPGVVNVIAGDGPGAGASLVEDPRVDKIAFTGGGEAGRLIIKSAADTIKRMSIELGGKNPNLIFADADFEQAVDGALFGAFANQGEVCSAGSRLLVERTIYDRLLAALIERTDKVLGHIEAGRSEGRLVAGGGRARGPGLDKGNFVQPTIFADVDNRAHIAQTEIFGPVLVVIPFTDEADAIRIANDTPYGLAAGVWTRDAARGIRVMKLLRAGILWMNTYHPTYNEAPWGGYKQSGFGRELGPRGLDQYLETKQMNINLADAPLAWY